MFGLPAETALLVFGAPVIWIIYTAVFLIRSRNWQDDESAGDDGS